MEFSLSPKEVVEHSTFVTIGFEEGIPVSLNNEELDPVTLIAHLNKLAGAHGIGIKDIIENRLVVMKSRGVYETPVGNVLYHTHNKLEELTLDRDTFHYKELVAHRFGELVYNGSWFSLLREALQSFVDQTQLRVTKKVKLELYKGNIIDAGGNES